MHTCNRRPQRKLSAADFKCINCANDYNCYHVHKAYLYIKCILHAKPNTSVNATAKVYLHRTPKWTGLYRLYLLKRSRGRGEAPAPDFKRGSLSTPPSWPLDTQTATSGQSLKGNSIIRHQLKLT